MSFPTMYIAALLLLLGTVNASQLRFSSDGTFKVVQFTDLHYGEDPHLDELSNEVQTSVVKQESPSLVVFSGDMVSGHGWNGRSGWYSRRWQQVANPVCSSGLPHAAILGNHDGEADLGRRQIIALAGRQSNVSISQTDPAGTSYFLDIFDPDGAVLAARIWMLDSNDRGCGQLRAGWGCVTPDTLSWVKRTAEELPTVPSLAFIHIPVPEFMKMWNGHETHGSKGEPVGCPLHNTRAFNVLREIGVRAIYSGHDHYNDFVGKMHGVRLAYGRKSGYGGYGPREGTLRGARVILLQRGENPAHSETWIRQEDGSRVDQLVTEPAAKLDTQQHTCISDLGLLGWVGWSTRTARMATGGTVAGIVLVAVASGFVVVWGSQRKWAVRRRGGERELSRSVSRTHSERSASPPSSLPGSPGRGSDLEGGAGCISDKSQTRTCGVPA